MSESLTRLGHSPVAGETPLETHGHRFLCALILLSGTVLCACGGGGGGTTPTATDTTAPSVPTGLTAAATSQIDLSWTASTDNVGVTGYRVERCQGAGCSPSTQIATPTTNVLSDTGLSADTAYSYRVRATDAAGNLSAYSSIVSATTVRLAARYDFTDVSIQMQAAVGAGQLPGIGLIVVDRDGVLYEEAVGENTLETSSLIASATKLTSGTTMMALVDEGLIRLDDRIDKHLPYFTDAKGAITIEQLLAQTHGMPEGHACIPPPGEENGLTLAECVEQIARDVVPLRPPGTACEYAPAVSYQIMGRIAEVVTSEPWESVWRTRVGDPLMMTNTTFGAVLNPRVGGGISTTLDDYAHLVQMHLLRGEWSGQRVLSEWAVDEMQRDRCVDIPFLSDSRKPEVGYGLTWWVDENDAAGVPKQLSVAGFYGAIPWINHERNYAAFWLTDDDLPSSALVWSETVPLIHAALDSPQP